MGPGVCSVDRCCVFRMRDVDREIIPSRSQLPKGGYLRREIGSVDRCCVLKTQHVDHEVLLARN